MFSKGRPSALAYVRPEFVWEVSVRRYSFQPGKCHEEDQRDWSNSSRSSDLVRGSCVASLVARQNLVGGPGRCLRPRGTTINARERRGRCAENGPAALRCRRLPLLLGLAVIAPSEPPTGSCECGQCRTARARQRHNDFISVAMENGDLLFKSLFVGGDLFHQRHRQDAPMLVGGVAHEPQAHS